MIEKFVKRTQFESHQDFIDNYDIIVPKNFNFAYDVADEWASTHPDKRALCWTNDKGAHRDLTFGELKMLSDRTASFFQSIGIGRGDKVMLILKRSIEFWQTILALHKIGAIAIPATHLLTDKDLVYRNNAADIKAIVATEDDNLTTHVNLAMAKSPSVQHRIMVGENRLDRFSPGSEGGCPLCETTTGKYKRGYHDPLLHLRDDRSAQDGDPRFHLPPRAYHHSKILAQPS